MTRYTKHRILEVLLNALVIIILWQAGAGYWSLIAIAYGVWCFYDGITRVDLRREHDAIKMAVKNVESTYRQSPESQTK